jgi:hypothetical protein
VTPAAVGEVHGERGVEQSMVWSDGEAER